MVPCKSTAKEVSFEWSHHSILSTDSKVGTTLHVSILTLGVKELNTFHSFFFQEIMNGEKTGNNAFAAKKKKRMSVERIYQKKTQLEHILLRPDTYVGSVEPIKQSMWVYDEQLSAIVSREITYVPGLYKIFDELLGE